MQIAPPQSFRRRGPDLLPPYRDQTVTARTGAPHLRRLAPAKVKQSPIGVADTRFGHGVPISTALRSVDGGRRLFPLPCRKRHSGRQIKWESDIGSGNLQLENLVRHIRKPRQMQLVGNGDRLRRSRTVFGDNQVSLTTARVISLERIRPMQEDHHIRILLDRA